MALAQGSVVVDRQSEVTLYRPANVREGQLWVVELEVGDGCENPAVLWFGERYAMHAVQGRWHALVPVPLGARAGLKTMLVQCAQVRIAFRVPLVVGEFPESKLSVDPKFTKKPPSRVVRESAAISAALQARNRPRQWQARFVLPSENVFTSPFGVRRTFNGKLKSRHRGLDIDGETGEPLVASNDGIVTLAADNFYYVGNAVFIDHGNNMFSMYFHMSTVAVKTGQRVMQGQTIGTVGATGRVTGSHVHFAIKNNGVYFDPLDLIAYDPDKLLEAQEPLNSAK